MKLTFQACDPELYSKCQKNSVDVVMFPSCHDNSVADDLVLCDEDYVNGSPRLLDTRSDKALEALCVFLSMFCNCFSCCE